MVKPELPHQDRCINPNYNFIRAEFLHRFFYELRILHRNGTKDNSGYPKAKTVFNIFHGADTAADFHRNTYVFHNLL